MKKKLLFLFTIYSSLLGCKTNQINDIFSSLSDNNQTINNSTSPKVPFGFQEIKTNYQPFYVENYKKNVLIAIKKHPSIQSGIFTITSLEAGESIAESDNKPQVSFQASAGANRVDSENKIAGLGSVAISKIIYDDGAINKNVISQKMRTRAAKEELNNNAENLALSAYLTLFELAKNQKIENFYYTSLKMGEPLITQINSISESGIADKTMILKAKKEYSELKIQSIQAKTLTKNTELQFMNIFQSQSIPKLKMSKPLKISKLSSLLNKMKRNHPLIKSQNALINSLNKSLDAVKSQKNPNISIRASVNSPANDPVKDVSGNVGFLLNYIYNEGGRLDSQIKNLDAQIKATERSRDDILRNLSTQLKTTYENYLGALQSKNEIEALVMILKETRDTSKAQLVSGRAKIQDVLSNELDLAKKEIELISVDTNLISASYRIKSLSTGLIPRFTK